jgi:hypothetical protein
VELGLAPDELGLSAPHTWLQSFAGVRGFPLSWLSRGARAKMSVRTPAF